MNRNLQPKYWNPYLETLSVLEIKKLQLKRFKEAFDFAFNYSKNYRDLYDRHKISPFDIKNMRDIKKIPIVNKQFFVEKENKLVYGRSLAVNPDEVVYFHQTSGTTSQPLRQPDTLEDWVWWGECWSTVLWAQGIRQRDRVLFPFNYSTFIGFWGAHYACEKIGAEIISTGSMSTKERIEKIFELNATVIITTPTYAFRMLEVAREQMNLDLLNSSVRRIICAGEPGALIPSTKKELETRWGCQVFDHIGATEVGAWGFECLDRPGGIHINETMFLVELLELESDNRINEPGKFGRLVITAFHRKGRPVIRFDTRDIACWDENKCKCGRTFRLLKGGIQGRADHLLKVRGTFVTPAIIENIIHEDHHLSNEYQLLIGEKKRDSLSLVVEINPGVPESKWKEIIKKLAERIHSETHLRFDINLKRFGEISRGNFKSQRIIDRRKKESYD